MLGPNGSGKTTLMRAVLGLCPPVAGTIRVFGDTPRRGDAAIGYLPQTRTVIPDLRMRGLDFIGSSLNGHRWGLPAHDAADPPAAVAGVDRNGRPGRRQEAHP